MQRFETGAIIAVSAAGVMAFLLPFLIATPSLTPADGESRPVDASLLLAVVVAGALITAIGEIARGAGAGSLSRSVALLGILVAIDATLRLVPSFFGASPIFALIVLVGYVFGSRFGFVMGTLTLLLSAAITAGIGPWLPFQMLCAAWIGLAAGWLPRWRLPRAEVATLAVFGAATGLIYGALINLYVWPFAAPGGTIDAGLYWYPGLGVRETLDRYAAFYVATSLAHDVTRSVGNVVLILVAGLPVLRLLRRFRTRTSWTATEIDERQTRQAATHDIQFPAS